MRIQGFEPRRSEWKSEMLPLHHIRIIKQYNELSSMSNKNHKS
jgi:hypothetical protein